jgi:hypothetical protein
LVLLVAGCAGGSQTILSTVGASVGDGSAEGPSAAPSGPAGVGSGAYGAGNQGGAPNAARDEAKIVRTGTMSLQVTDLEGAVARGRDAIRAAGGYVSASRQANDGERSVAVITYRIPSDRWDESLDAIRKLASKVIDEETGSVEVTNQLIDLEARIANLRASEKALQAIFEKATKIPDILEVQNQLTTIRGQIEQLDAQRAHLSDQASYGTMQVTYGLEVHAVTEAAKGWNAGDEVDRATASLVDVLQALTSAGIWFAIVWLPILLFIGLVVAIGAFVLRRAGVIRKPEPPAAAPAA